MTLKYTKAIKNGKVKATEIQVGESITGTLLGVRENKFGTQNPLIEVNGTEVEIYAAGNLKFLAEKIDRGQLTVGAFTTITRGEDGTTKKGYSVTQFDVVQDQTNQATSTSNVPTSSVSVKDKLQAIRANRTTN